jgi:glycerol-3-phosphate dehydrogenase
MKISVLGCGRWGSFIAWYQATIKGNQVINWGPEGDYSYEILKNTVEYVKSKKGGLDETTIEAYESLAVKQK